MSSIGRGTASIQGISGLRRTVYLVGNAFHLIPDQVVGLGIPNFACRARFPRAPVNTIDVTITNAFYNRGPYPIAVGADGEIEIFPGDWTMVIRNRGGVDIANMVVEFDLCI